MTNANDFGLDPKDPEDLRRVAGFLREWNRMAGDLPNVAVRSTDLRAQADRLDRERAGQAQDEADRKLAEEIADNEGIGRYSQFRSAFVRTALAGIRAGRAAGGAS